MTARRLLLLNGMARTICGVLLPAALIILVNSGISEAQQAAAAAPSLLAAQSSGQQANLSMTGCRATSDRTAAITFVDEHHNIWYRATKKGLNLTNSNKKVYIIGGLLPTWNLAAQAGSEGGTAPGNTMTAIAWTLPNEQLGASPYPAPKVRIAWVPGLNATCQTP
jgi:hypothetical protein